MAPDDALKKLVGDAERNSSQFSILLEDQTTGFIETDLKLRINLPNFLQTMLTPLFNMSDVVLSTILISIENKEDVGKIRKIAANNNVFLIDFKDIIENEN